MSRGLGRIQRQTLEYLRSMNGWSVRAREVAEHVYGEKWDREFTDSEYQHAATALRTLCDRGLAYKLGPGLYASELPPRYEPPKPSERDLQVDELLARCKETRERALAKLASINV